MNPKLITIISAVMMAPLTLSNCAIKIDASSSSEGKKLFALEESRTKGMISESAYLTQRDKIMKSVKP